MQSENKRFKTKVPFYLVPMQKAKFAKSWIAMVQGASAVKLQDFFDAAFSLAQEEGKLSDAIEYYKSSEAGRKAFIDRPRMNRLDLEYLKSLPAGTLGHVYAQHIVDTGIDPAAFANFIATTDHQYVLAYLFETHDLFHVLGGFGTDYEGELELQGFYAAQSPGRISPMILAAGLMNCALYNPKMGPKRLGRIVRAFQMGKNAKLIFGTDFDHLWDQPLSQVRQSLGIQLGDGV